MVGLTAHAFEPGRLTLTFTDLSRADRPIPVDVYFPADTPGEALAIGSGETAGVVIPEYIWPESAGAVFRGAMADPDFQSLIGEFDRIEFGWRW